MWLEICWFDFFLVIFEKQILFATCKLMII